MFRERNQTRVSCEVCGVIMEASYLPKHMKRTHSKILTHTRGVDTGGGGADTYVVSLPCVLKLVTCP